MKKVLSPDKRGVGHIISFVDTFCSFRSFFGTFVTKGNEREQQNKMKRNRLDTLALLLTLGLLWWASRGTVAAGGRPFITVWRAETAGQVIKPGIIGSFNVSVEREDDGTLITQQTGVDDNFSFTAPTPGNYKVTAAPEGITRFQASHGNSEKALLFVNQFGDVKWQNMQGAFSHCENMQFADGIDAPNLEQVKDMSSMFYKCHSFNAPLDDWDVRHVESLNNLFAECEVFNQPLNNWNTGSVTDMDGVFSGCKAFDQPLFLWDVSKVTTMNGMFNGCETFNQPLDSWNVHIVKEMKGLFNGCKTFNQPLDKWYVRRVTKMSGMFEDCQKFNQPLNSWEVYEVTDMEGMFLNCQSFNQPLNEWDVSEVVNMKKIFQGCTSFNQDLGAWKLEKCTHIGLGKSGIDIENFSKTLEKWANESYLESVTLEASYLQYAWQAPVATLRTKGWTINGCTHDPRYIRVRITPSELSLTVSHLSTLRADIFASDGLNQEVIWLSDTPTIAAVNKVTGEVTALALGTATITATSTADPSQHATCQVTVGRIRSVTIIPSSLSLTVGATQTLNATVTAIGGVEETVKWSSSAPTIAAVDEGSGVVTALAPGTAIITATSTADPSQHATCQVTVGAVQKVTVTPAEASMLEGMTFALSAQVKVFGNVPQSVFWVSSNENVALVDEASGEVTALAPGRVLIVAVSTADLTQRGACTLRVTPITPPVEIVPVTRITVSPEDAKLKVGERRFFTARVFPATATEKGYSWRTDNPAIAEVSETGEVVARSVGTCQLIAHTTETGSAVKGVCQLTILPAVTPVARLIVSPSVKTLKVNEAVRLRVRVIPSNATEKGYTWRSDNPAIAEVSETGEVVARSVGTCQLIAHTTETGSAIEGVCHLTVIAAETPVVKVSAITLTGSQPSLTVGERVLFSAMVLPTTATEKGVTWHSSNETVAEESPSGEVTGKGVGTCRIIAHTTEQGSSIEGVCQISVRPRRVPVERLVVTPQATTLSVAEKLTLKAMVLPSSATEKGVMWHSSDETVATVDATGNVTAKALGTCQLIAQSNEAGSAVEGVCHLTVSASVVKVSTITLVAPHSSLEVDERMTLTATIVPDNASEKGVTWHTSDEAVATVDATGEVTGKAAGTCTLTATTKEVGSAVKGTWELTVVAKGNAVEDAALASLTIAPNPFTSQLRIVNPTGGKAGYELVDAAGVVVRSGVLHATEEFIDTTLLPTGLYFVRLMGQKGGGTEGNGIPLLK